MYYYPFLVAAVCNTIAFLLAFGFLPETLPARR
jgi:hypothetical protein